MARLIESVLGHEAVWQALMQGRQGGHLPHAMAFVGAAGIGKKRVAWALAQALVCEGENPSCGLCPACKRVANEQSESVLFIESEKGSIKLEAAHQILQFLNLQRMGRARVVIIDSAQSLNPQAANALLKAIEEPPEQTYFILLVSELSQLLPTLRSRVQVLRFAPLSEDQLAQGEEVPQWMRRSARGSFAQLATFRETDNNELRMTALDYLGGALVARRSGLDAILDRGKDREVALKALHFLQQLLRDWSVLDLGPVMHSDLEPQLRALPELATATRIELWRQAFLMEQDLMAHVDRGLIFENFYYRARQAMG